MDETMETEQVGNPSTNEKNMRLLINRYLCHVLKELPVIEFHDEQFLALIDILFHNSKVGAIQYLRSLFQEPDREWNSTGQNNNKFERFIKTDYLNVKPLCHKYPLLGLKDAKDIVDWIEANRRYTAY